MFRRRGFFTLGLFSAARLAARSRSGPRASPLASVAGPQYIEVTAAKPQKHIQVTSSSLGEGFWAFSIDISMNHVEIPTDRGAYLILRNAKGNLLSTVIRPSPTNKGTMNFYAAVHLDLLRWAQVEVRDNQTIYVVKLESFQKMAQEHLQRPSKPLQPTSGGRF